MMRKAAIAAVLAGVATLGGCEKALFPEQIPRSPYERYDQLRGRTAPQTEKNSFGGSQPALRDRLRPMGNP